MVLLMFQAIPMTPIRIKVDPSHDASKVKAEGPGLSRSGKTRPPVHEAVHYGIFPFVLFISIYIHTYKKYLCYIFCFGFYLLLDFYMYCISKKIVTIHCSQT